MKEHDEYLMEFGVIHLREHHNIIKI